MEAATLPIYNTEGKQVDSIKLDPEVFDGVIHTHSLYLAIRAHLLNKRRGLASTKTRGEVSGGGKKPWRQKGTGRARVGSIRSPLWRHGGVIFGPHPRDFSCAVPEKIKKLALKSSLNAKVKENNIIVLDALKIEKPKTKEAMRVFSNLNIAPKKNAQNSKTTVRVLLLLDKVALSEKLALRNISFLETNTAQNTHAYEVLRSEKLVITKDGLKGITQRLKT